MASSVSGKIAFITGGASGIGAALTTKLVDGGAEVWIADRQIGPAQELAQRLNSGGGKAGTTKGGSSFRSSRQLSSSCWGFVVFGCVCCGYAAVRGMGAPMRVKARRWSSVGSVSMWISVSVPVKRIWLRVRVAR